MLDDLDGRIDAVLDGGPTTLGVESTIIDLAWGPDGYLYVLEHSTGPAFFALPGDVVRVGPGCAKTTVASGLNRPGSLAFGRDSKLYVSINSTSVGTGQVVRIDP